MCVTGLWQPCHSLHSVKTDLELGDGGRMLLRNVRKYEDWPLCLRLRGLASLPTASRIGLSAYGFEQWVQNVSNLFSDINVISLSWLHTRINSTLHVLVKWKLRRSGIFLSQFQSEVHFVTLDNQKERNFSWWSGQLSLGNIYTAKTLRRGFLI